MIKKTIQVILCSLVLPVFLGAVELPLKKRKQILNAKFVYKKPIHASVQTDTVNLKQELYDAIDICDDVKVEKILKKDVDNFKDGEIDKAFYYMVSKYNDRKIFNSKSAHAFLKLDNVRNKLTPKSIDGAFSRGISRCSKDKIKVSKEILTYPDLRLKLCTKEGLPESVQKALLYVRSRGHKSIMLNFIKHPILKNRLDKKYKNELLQFFMENFNCFKRKSFKGCNNYFEVIFNFVIDRNVYKDANNETLKLIVKFFNELLSRYSSQECLKKNKGFIIESITSVLQDYSMIVQVFFIAQLEQCDLVKKAILNFNPYLPFYIPINDNDVDSMKQLFLRNRSNIDVINDFNLNGYHILHFAALCDATDIIEYLVSELKVPINIQTKDELKATPLDVAILAGSYNAIKLLKELGA